MHLFPGRFILASFLLFGSGATSHSAEPAAATGAPTELAPVVVHGRDTDLVGVAQSSSQGIVGAAELAERPMLRRGELLEVIPGVVITQHSGDGKANQYFLRGFNLDHGTDFSIGVEGMPVNMRTHAHGQGYADLNFLIPELVRQVDYSKGPFYPAVGDFSAAGAADFGLFDALPHPFVSLSVGENNYGRVVAAGSRGGDRVTTAALEVTHDDGPWHVAENSTRINGFVRQHWSDEAAEYRLTAMAYHGEWHSTDQIPLRAVTARTLDRFGNLDSTDGGETTRASLSFDATFKGAAATTQLQAYAIYYALNLFSDFTYFLDDPVNGDQFNQRDRRWLVGGTFSRTWTSAGSNGGGQTTVGAEARADLIGELGLFHTANRRRLSTQRNDRVNEASLGVYVQNEMRWREWLRTNGGVRVDGYGFDVVSDTPANSGRRTAAIVSPKLGAVIGPFAKFEFYLNAGFGFHSNDARGTTIRVDPADAVTPTDAVTPLVRSRGAELGARTSALPGLVTSLSLWALDLDSELIFVGDAGGTEPTGRTRRYGVELANFYRPNAWLTFDADLAFTHGRYRDLAPSGAFIANSIDTVVTAGATAGKSKGGFGSVRLRYFAPQPLTEDGTVRGPSSLSLNARLGWRTPRWECAVDVLNVTNRQNYDIAYYYASRLPGEAPGGVEDIHFHPAEPLTFRASLTRRF